MTHLLTIQSRIRSSNGVPDRMEEEQAAADPGLKTESNPSASKAAKAKFKHFFGVEPAKNAAYADTACSTSWDREPAEPSRLIESEMSLQILKLIPTLLDHKSAFFVEDTDFSSNAEGKPASVTVNKRKFTTFNEQELKQMHELGSDAPFGRGTETVIDKKVRSCKEFSASQLNIDGAHFLETYGSDSKKSQVLELIRRRLSPHCDVIRSELYKMLVYGPGDFFEEHVDTQRCDSMFATLVVMLPSSCKGGTLTIEHDFNKTSQDANKGYVHWVAFFADCKHAVLPVTEGYRACFVFNLTYAFSGAPVPSLAEQDPERKLLESIIAVLKSEKVAKADKPNKFVAIGHLLDHKYALSLLQDGRALKGADARLYQDAISHPEVETYICPVTIQLNGIGFDDDVVVSEEDLTNEPGMNTYRTWAIDPGHVRKGAAGYLKYAVLCETPLQELGVHFLQDATQKVTKVGSMFIPSGNEGTSASFTYVHGVLIFKLKDPALQSSSSSNKHYEPPQPKKRKLQ